MAPRKPPICEQLEWEGETSPGCKMLRAVSVGPGHTANPAALAGPNF